MMYLLVIPGFLIGALFGGVFFALIPGLVIGMIWHRSHNCDWTELPAILQRPAAIVGGILGVVLALLIASTYYAQIS